MPFWRKEMLVIFQLLLRVVSDQWRWETANFPNATLRVRSLSDESQHKKSRVLKKVRETELLRAVE